MQTNDAYDCLYSTKTKYIFTAWCGVYLLFLPIFLYVLYVGFRRCTNPRSSFTSSHSDVITFHMVAIELWTIFSSLDYSGFYRGPSLWSKMGGKAVTMCLVGQALFHCLTCAERYLAVVHPITYICLRKKGGVTIRNISIGCVWLCSVEHCFLINVEEFQPVYELTAGFILAALSLNVIGFCSVSVICVLIRPGPGEGGRDGRIPDKSKRSALETVVTVLAVLLLRFNAFLIGNALHFTKHLAVQRCLVTVVWLWFGLPSSLVLPLLFLRRAGKLTWFKTRKDTAHLPSKVQGSNATTDIA